MKLLKKIFVSFLQKYQKGWKESMKDSEFIFDSVDLLQYKLHKIKLNRNGSHIDSPKRLKNKNKNDKRFQYTVTVPLNHKNIAKYPQRIAKLKPFIHKYDWKEISFSSN